MTSFEICDEFARALEELQYDETLGPSPLMGAVSSLIWRDEFLGRSPIDAGCHGQCRRAFRALLKARVHLWEQGQVPEELGLLWAQAQQRIAKWPGFQRLSLDAEDQEAQQSLNGMTASFHELICKEADEVSVTSNERGELGWSAVTYFDKQPEDREAEEGKGES